MRLSSTASITQIVFTRSKLKSFVKNLFILFAIWDAKSKLSTPNTLRQETLCGYEKPFDPSRHSTTAADM